MILSYKLYKNTCNLVVTPLSNLNIDNEIRDNSLLKEVELPLCEEINVFNLNTKRVEKINPIEITTDFFYIDDKNNMNLILHKLK